MDPAEQARAAVHHGGGEEAEQARHPQHRAPPARPPLPRAGSPAWRRLLRLPQDAMQARARWRPAAARPGPGGYWRGARRQQAGHRRLLHLNWIASRSPGRWRRIGAWSGGEASGNPCEVRRGEWGWAGELSRGCGGGSHQPTAAGRQAISPFRPSPPSLPPLGFSLSARWRDGGGCLRWCCCRPQQLLIVSAVPVLFNFALRFRDLLLIYRPLFSLSSSLRRERTGGGLAVAGGSWPGSAGRQRKGTANPTLPALLPSLSDFRGCLLLRAYR